MTNRYSSASSSVCLGVKVLDVNKLAYLWNFHISVDLLRVNLLLPCKYVCELL